MEAMANVVVGVEVEVVEVVEVEVVGARRVLLLGSRKPRRNAACHHGTHFLNVVC